MLRRLPRTSYYNKLIDCQFIIERNAGVSSDRAGDAPKDVTASERAVRDDWRGVYKAPPPHAASCAKGSCAYCRLKEMAPLDSIDCPLLPTSA
jgi:hypothetical protein